MATLEHDTSGDLFETQDLVINMGPQHPSTHGVLRIEVVTDGELVKGAYPEIGYLHRCFEKHAESLEYIQVVPYTDRMDYISAMNMELGFALTVEKLLGVEIPERAQTVRVIVAELNRIASHLLAIGTYSMDVGGFTPFLYAFRDREHILAIFEELCGARLLYNYIRPGGISRDITRGLQDRILEFCRYFRPQLEELDGLLTKNLIFIKRTAGVGVIPLDVAVSYGLSGPNLRGSGLAWDLRKERPYSGYEKYDFDVCYGRGEKGQVGDCWDRYAVRVREMEQSLRIIEQAARSIPVGEIMAKLPRTIKAKGETYLSTECPRGELGYYLVGDGSKKPYRVKAKSPCFISISLVNEICSGMMVADLVAFLGSLDFMMGEVDR